MLRVGQETPNLQHTASEPALTFDFSRPIDFDEIDRQITTPWLSPAPANNKKELGQPQNSTFMGLAPLPCPLVTSGLPTSVIQQLDATLRPLGFVAVPGIAGSTASDKNQNAKLVPGASLAIPLVSGDIKLQAIGTVTEVVGDKVYGFGHRFLGYGPVDFPMATAQVHTVISSLYRSFKFGSAIKIVGALTDDESTAVLGRIGAQATTIPLTIKVDRYNDAKTRTYDCRLASNRLWTPLLLRLTLPAALLMRGGLPPDHTIEYDVTIRIENTDDITFKNVSTSLGLNEMVTECAVPVALLMNNPYKTVKIESIDVQAQISPKNIASHIWSVDLADLKTKAGEDIEFEVVLESVLADKKKYRRRLKIPPDSAPGKYGLLVCGAKDYQEFLRKAAPYRFVPENLSGLIEAINNILTIRRDRLYYLLALPADGLTVEKAQLPDLPATKALILQNAKRTLRTQPYQHWTEKSARTGTIIINKKVMNITVEK
jgi:hypothetical protein